jgi:hypothetical protein
MGMFDDIPVDSTGDARSQIGKPEELSFGEKLMSGVSLPSWMDNLRGRLPFRVMQGMADPSRRGCADRCQPRARLDRHSPMGE